MMARGRKKRSADKPVAEAPKRSFTRADIGRLLALVGVTAAVFCVYRVLIDFSFFDVVLAVYIAAATVSVLGYVIYNRGFSRKGVTREMLPDSMTDEEKTEFIEDGERRLKRSRPLLILIVAFCFTFAVDVIELYALPLIKELFSR